MRIQYGRSQELLCSTLQHLAIHLSDNAYFRPESHYENSYIDYFPCNLSFEKYHLNFLSALIFPLFCLLHDHVKRD